MHRRSAESLLEGLQLRYCGARQIDTRGKLHTHQVRRQLLRGCKAGPIIVLDAKTPVASLLSDTSCAPALVARAEHVHTVANDCLGCNFDQRCQPADKRGP